MAKSSTRKGRSVKIRVASDERPGPGRKTKYEARFVNTVKVMAENGMTDRAMAQALGVAYSTFREWVGRHPKLREAMAIPKAVANDLVKLSLYNLARGYDVEEEEVKVLDGELVRVRVTRHVPANFSAIAMWLNNRMPEEFRRNPEPLDDAPPPAPGDDAIDITPDNVREIARRFALTLRNGALNG